MSQHQGTTTTLRPLTPPARTALHVPMLSPTRTENSPSHPLSYKSGHVNIDTFSPVNQNGSFEFDRVLKSSKVHRRVKKKGAWKPSWKLSYLVLRPNLLSIYKSPDETGLRGSITLSDVTAVAQVKKTHTDNVFGVFTSAKNYHFQGLSAQDSKDWIDRIRNEGRMEMQDELLLPSPRYPQEPVYESTSGEDDGTRPVSPLVQIPNLHAQAARSRTSTTGKRTSAVNDYSGTEVMTSHSDFSDVPSSLPKSMAGSVPKPWTLTPIVSGHDVRPMIARNASQLSGFDMNSDPERVIRQGWLQSLSSKGSVKSWKTLWVVLRPKTLSFYKGNDEYSAQRVVPMASVINAADIDPMSRSKKYCFQIIVEDRTYRLCAPSEEGLAKWLGALKSVLAKRQEATRHVADAAANMTL